MTETDYQDGAILVCTASTLSRSDSPRRNVSRPILSANYQDRRSSDTAGPAMMATCPTRNPLAWKGDSWAGSLPAT